MKQAIAARPARKPARAKLSKQDFIDILNGAEANTVSRRELNLLGYTLRDAVEIARANPTVFTYKLNMAQGSVSLASGPDKLSKQESALRQNPDLMRAAFEEVQAEVLAEMKAERKKVAAYLSKLDKMIADASLAPAKRLRIVRKAQTSI